MASKIFKSALTRQQKWKANSNHVCFFVVNSVVLLTLMQIDLMSCTNKRTILKHAICFFGQWIRFNGSHLASTDIGCTGDWLMAVVSVSKVIRVHSGRLNIVIWNQPYRSWKIEFQNKKKKIQMQHKKNVNQGRGKTDWFLVPAIKYVDFTANKNCRKS